MSSLTPLTTATLVSISAEGASLATGHGVNMKPVIGGFILGIFLLGLDAINDRVATYISIMILVTAALVNGMPILSKITGQNYNKKPAGG